jgi:hypothetical protein
MALDKLGANRITDLDSDQSLPAIKCRLHFEQTRDALIRSHYWRFASGRSDLTVDTSSPDFEWANQFVLPTDYMMKKNVWSGNGPYRTNFSYAIEGQLILTNEDNIKLRYIKQVTDPTEFDSLFIEVLILKLALKLVSLAGANPKMTETLGRELAPVMRQVRAADRQETNTIGREDLHTWNSARLSNGGRIDSQLGS